MQSQKQSIITTYLQDKDLDGLFIYNSFKEEPSYMSWFLDQDVFDVHYMIITKTGDIKLCVAWWFEHMAKQKYNLDIVPAPQKVHMIQYMLPQLQGFTKLWVAGNIPYKEYMDLSWYDIQDVESDLQKIFATKTSHDLEQLIGMRNYTTGILDTLEIKADETELDIYRRIAEQVKKDGYELHFLSITWNAALKETTVAEATEATIHEWDVLCIDFGLIRDGYNSDATRCYFVWDNALQAAYHSIQHTIQESLAYIQPGKSNKVFVEELIALCKKNWLDNYILTDLGHGIGTSLHEYPDLYHSEFTFENGMVFTIEPEFRVGEYLLRYEDVYTLQDGKCTLISEYHI